MDRIDLSLPADSPGDGSRRRAHPAIPIAHCPDALPLPGSRGADGVHQLHHALRHLHALLLRLWIELFCRVGVLPNLLRGPGHLDRAVDREPPLAAMVPVRPAGMAVAEPDLLETAAVQAAGVSGIRPG